MAAANVIDGRTVVTTAGTRVRLVAQGTVADASQRVIVTAFSTNTNVVTIGAATVVGAAATRRGVGLAAGATQAFSVNDPSQLWVDAVTNGEGVSFVVEY
jgi:hypothetical protein